MDQDIFRRAAIGLGLFSAVLGVAELLQPGRVGEATGIGRRKSGLIRAAGLRELTAGLGILLGGPLGPWLWARVAGDAADLAMLGPALGSGEKRRRRAAASIAAVAGVTAVDAYCASRAGNSRVR